jgi:hypothetical protein
VRNGPSCAQLFENPVFVAGRNFWRQHFCLEGAKALAVSALEATCVAARNFYRQQKLDFRKLGRKKTHFAPRFDAIATFRLDLVSDEIL